jgi:hypothetical protein
VIPAEQIDQSSLQFHYYFDFWVTVAALLSHVLPPLARNNPKINHRLTKKERRNRHKEQTSKDAPPAPPAKMPVPNGANFHDLQKVERMQQASCTTPSPLPTSPSPVTSIHTAATTKTGISWVRGFFSPKKYVRARPKAKWWSNRKRRYDPITDESA